MRAKTGRDAWLLDAPLAVQDDNRGLPASIILTAGTLGTLTARNEIMRDVQDDKRGLPASIVLTSRTPVTLNARNEIMRDVQDDRRGLPASIVLTGRTPVPLNARTEIMRGVQGMLRNEAKVSDSGAIVLGTVDSLRAQFPERGAPLKAEGFRMRHIGKHQMIVDAGENGPLYGAFALLPALFTKLGGTSGKLDEQVPHTAIRRVNHWDKLDGTIRINGVSRFKVSVASQMLDRWNADIHFPSRKLDGGSSTRRMIVSVRLKMGDLNRIEDVPGGGDRAPLNHVEVTAVPPMWNQRPKADPCRSPVDSGPMSSAIQILKDTPLFAVLDDGELDSLAARAALHPFDAGENLFIEGEPCKGLYIVVTGRVRIFKMSLSGREQKLSIEGPGASVAQLPVFDGGTYPASGSAIGKTETLFISRADPRAICLENPEVSLKLSQVVGKRLRRLVGII